MNKLADAFSALTGTARRSIRLTDSVARSTPLPKARVVDGKTVAGERIIFDDKLKGFGVRLREKGARMWIVQTKVGAKQKRITMGSVYVFTAAQAREWAIEHLAHAALGVDKAAEKKMAEAAAINTFKNVADEFLKFKKSDVRPKSFEDLQRYINGHMKALHNLPLAKIDRGMIASTLNAIDAPVARNRCRASVTSLFSWALREGYCETNPAIGAGTPAKEAKRERVLSDKEIAQLWHALGDGEYADIIKLLLLTGCRRDEIGSLRHDEIDLERRLIFLPGDRTKNKRAHFIPLSEPAWAILHRYMPSNREFVFADRYSWGRRKRELNARLGDMPEWHVHDLRHTFVTGLNDLGVHPHIVEAAVNHASGFKAGIAGRYNHSAYLPEKTAALELWGRHVMALVERSSVRDTAVNAGDTVENHALVARGNVVG
jgi:integrase